MHNGRTALPFYYVQIAPYAGLRIAHDSAQGATSAELRESQMLTLANPTLEWQLQQICDDKLIHPPKKKPVGERLALWALVRIMVMMNLFIVDPSLIR